MKQKSTIQQNKFNNLLKDRKLQHDPEKITFNYSSHALSEAKNYLLLKVSNLNIPPKKVNYANYLVNFELFYRDICNLYVISAEDLDFMKTKSKDIALSSFCTYNNNVPQHLSKGEFDAVSQNKQVFTQNSDKGNSIFIVDRDTYIK